MNSLHADMLVVGFGKGGKIAASGLGQLGKRVVLVERSEHMYGGTCPNVGCVPTKALVHHSRKRRASDLPWAWYERSVNTVQELTALLRAGNYEALDSADTVTVITGKAMFLDPHTVAVDELTITADTILINTGSETIIPDVPGLRLSNYLRTSTELIESTTLPPRLAILGGGYLGIEFASIYRQFGSQVTIFEAARAILRHEDDDVAAAAARILIDEGVEIIAGADVVEVLDGEGDATVVYHKCGQRHTVQVDAILAAAGRKPATEGLGLGLLVCGSPVTARSRSMNTSGRVSPISSPSVTSTAVRSSRTFPWTTAGSCSTS
jgi:pyruvate/2-oxoglutarate dehydrogenase complex dihydrolipoamide dehydrogenase (E3) component